MVTGERMRTNGLSVQAAGATSLHPFVPTTIVGGDFAEGTRWYTLKFKNTTLAVAAADGSISEVPATAGNVDRTMPQQPDNQLWCFVGNEQEGYTLYNKAFGTTKALVAVAPATNTAEATMEPLEGNTKCAKWWFSVSSNPLFSLHRPCLYAIARCQWIRLKPQRAVGSDLFLDWWKGQWVDGSHRACLCDGA